MLYKANQANHVKGFQLPTAISKPHAGAKPRMPSVDETHEQNEVIKQGAMQST